MIAKMMSMNVQCLHSGKHVRAFLTLEELKLLKDNNKVDGDLIRIPYRIGDEFNSVSITCDTNMEAPSVRIHEDLATGNCFIMINQIVKDILIRKNRVEHAFEQGQVDLLAKIVGCREREEIETINRIVSFHDQSKLKK